MRRGPVHRVARSVRVRVAGLARRLVRAALLRYVRARPRGSGDRVTFLLGSAWGMGGTIRATLTLAGHLAETRDVEILSVVRRRRRPFFEFRPA
jgi:hypothetical protein